MALLWSGSQWVRYSPSGLGVSNWSAQNYTFGSIFRQASGGINSYRNLIGLNTAASGSGTTLMSMGFSNGNSLHWEDQSVSRDAAATLTDAVGSYAMFCTHTAGGVPRFHLFNLTTGAWTHIDTGASVSVAATTVLSVIQGSWQGSDFFNGDKQADAIWTVAFTDAQIESLGANIAAWMAANPVWAWTHRTQAATDTQRDATGRGGDEIARTGTLTVSTRSAPIPLSPRGAGRLYAPPPTAATPLPVLTFDGLGTNARFTWPSLDFRQPLSVCVIQARESSPFGDGQDQYMLTLRTNPLDTGTMGGDAEVWHFEHSQLEELFAQEWVPGVVGNDPYSGGISDATLDAFPHSFEVWFTWSGPSSVLRFHWRNLTLGSGWSHADAILGDTIFPEQLEEIVDGFLMVGSPDGNFGSTNFTGRIAVFMGWQSDLDSYLSADPFHVQTSDLQAIDPTNIRFGAELISDVPGDIVDLAGTGVECIDINAVLGATFDEWIFDGEAPGGGSPDADTAGTITLSLAATGAVAKTGTIAGVISVSAGATGSVAKQGTAVGVIAGALGAAGAAAKTGVAVGGMDLAISPTDDVIKSGTAAGAIAAQLNTDATAEKIGAVLAAVALELGLTGDVTTEVSVDTVGEIALLFGVDGAAVKSGTAAGGISLTALLEAVAAKDASAAAALALAFALSADAVKAGEVAGALGVELALFGEVEAIAGGNVTGEMALSLAVEAVAQKVAAVAGTIQSSLAAEGAAAKAGDVTGEMPLSIALTADAVKTATAVGVLSMVLSVAGDASQEGAPDAPSITLPTSVAIAAWLATVVITPNTLTVEMAARIAQVLVESANATEVVVDSNLGTVEITPNLKTVVIVPNVATVEVG